MSILLDALRKSEQREHLGEVPSIHSPGDALGSEQQSGGSSWPKWLWIIVAVLLAGLAFGYGWKLWAERHQVPLAEPEWPSSASAESRAGAAEPLARPPAPASENVGRQPRSPVESLVKKPQAERAVQSSAKADELPQASSPAASTPVQKLPPAAPAQVKTAPPASSPQPQKSSVQGSTGSTSNNANVAISYWQLPEDVRSNLPPLKINVLVFAEDPADRFILMGGKRYRHGSEVTDRLFLSYIQRDRAVFRHRAYRFYVKQ